MNKTASKLVTITTEAVLETTLLAEIEALGAPGYTVTDVRGKGSRGRRDAGWAPHANIRIDVVCDVATAEALCQSLSDRYGANYPMLITLADITSWCPAHPSAKRQSQ